MQMQEFKWTFGDKPEKSYIKQQKQPIEIANTNANTNPANNNPINEFSNHIGEFRKASKIWKFNKIFLCQNLPMMKLNNSLNEIIL